MVFEAVTKPSSCNTSDEDIEETEDYKVESASNASSSEEEDDDYQGAVVLHEDNKPPTPTFGNISVTNSSDVHFGNKTFYQGPVTIKQFMYSNGQASIGDSDSDEVKRAIQSEINLDPLQLANGVDNPAFKGDIPNSVNKFKEDKVVETVPTTGLAKGIKWLQNYSQKHLVLVITVLAILVVSLAIMMVIMLVKNAVKDYKPQASYVPREDSDEQTIVRPVPPPLDPAVNLTLPAKLKIVSRIEWVAQPQVEPANKLNTPVPYVIIMHTATQNCSSRAECNFHVRYIQMFHIESNHWWDIGYNFLVGGDGNAYEGRGWESEGAHTYGYNARSIGIAFIGTFSKILPTQIQMTACKQLIEKGVKLGYISKQYKLLAARQLQTTESPGAMLYEELKKWPHWSPSP